ncbi:MAG: SufE family protein [Pseudoalteromonas sp.]|uniref:SufE family protein n=1 Tax=unclassified Pseudoalteromonas TaxID=194690 RepID=UPI003F973027
MTNSFKEITSNIQQATGWQQKYRQIMLLGKQLPTFPAPMKVDDALVKGCESNVWLYIDFDLSEKHLVLAGDSDTRIVKGLLALILALYNGLTPEQASEVDAYEQFNKMGLINHLSPSRGNGIKAIVDKIQKIALEKSV